MRHVFLRGALTKQALACPFHACNMYFCAMTALTKQALACPFQACNVFFARCLHYSTCHFWFKYVFRGPVH